VELGTLQQCGMYYTKIEGNQIYLELHIMERPTLNNVTVYGIKKRKVEDIINDTDLKKGKKITESLIANTKNYLQNKYKKQGYLNAKVSIATAADTSGTNVQNMVVNVNKGDKVKIRKITFEGNEQLSNKRLRKALKNTKKKKLFRFWKKSKYIAADFDEDLSNLVDTYAERGYRDARVLSDTFVKVDEHNIDLTIKVEEGDKYYFGNIDFNLSEIPSTNGFSGPMMSISIFDSFINLTNSSISSISMLTLVPYRAVPGFPGVMNNLSKRGLWCNFHANADSLPPEPINKIFI